VGVALAVAFLLAAASTAAASGNPVLSYSEGVPGVPFSFVQLDPALTAGSTSDPLLQFVLPVARDLPVTSLAVSRRLDFGKPSLDKEFLSLAWTATAPRGANVFVSYSVDGGAWLPAVGGNGFDIPSKTHGRTIAFEVSLTTSDANATPTVDDVTIEYARWTGKPTDPSPGGGGGSSHQPGASHKPGSGSYTYPSSGGSSSSSSTTPATGGGYSGGSSSGSTSGGSGSGGSGSGSAGGSGSGASAAAGTPVSQATAVPSAPVPSPPASVAAGPSQSVSGLAVDPGAPLVTGVPLEPAGVTGSSGASNAPLSASAPVRFPVLPVASVALALAALFLVPGAFMASRLRRITGHDFERARLFGPFRLLRP
jgi:hypothetical protein